MIYEDHQKLENAYDQVLLKEGIEVPNMDVGQDSREPYEQHGMEDLEQKPVEQDDYKKYFSAAMSLLKGKVDYDTIEEIFSIMKKISSQSFSEGQRSGKETWKN